MNFLVVLCMNMLDILFALNIYEFISCFMHEYVMNYKPTFSCVWVIIMYELFL